MSDGLSGRLDRSVDVDITHPLLVDEGLDAYIAKFTPVIGVFDPAKRQLGIRPTDVVDEHHAGVYLTGDSQPTAHVRGKYRAAQAKVRVVAQRDGRVFLLAPLKQRHRDDEFAHRQVAPLRPKKPHRQPGPEAVQGRLCRQEPRFARSFSINERRWDSRLCRP